ncbi:MAG: hypothetical protein P8M25_14160 [Paracoccaceae bacterium]|nr:hypothetical protein [Paracoccaceae bacterium]
MHFSADPDAPWVKNGSKIILGYKAFARADELGSIDRVLTTSANCAESTQLGFMIKTAQDQSLIIVVMAHTV